MQHGAAQAEDLAVAVDRDRDLPVLVALLRRARGNARAGPPAISPGGRASSRRPGSPPPRRRTAPWCRSRRRPSGAITRIDSRSRSSRSASVPRQRCGVCVADQTVEQVGARVVARQHGAAFERHGAAAMQEQLLLEHVRRARERRVDVAVAHRNDGGDVAGEVAVHARRAGLARRRGSRSPPATTSKSTATAAAASSAR